MNKKLVYIITAVVLVIALAIAGTVYYVNANNYVAEVAGDKITKTEFQFFLSLAKYELAQTAEIKDWSKDKIGNEIAGDVAKTMALNNAREFKIELNKAKENNITLSAEKKKEIEDQFSAMKEGSGGAAKVEEEVKKQLNISFAEYKEIYRNIQLTYEFRDAERSKIKISDEDVKKYYDENIKKFEQATVRHILFMTVDSQTGAALPEDKQKEAEKKANDTLAKVNGGGDFAALAKELSEDPGSKDKGGEYTIFRNGQMVKEFEDWTFTHKPGETGIVKTTYGYHVMKLEKIGTATLDEMKESIRAELLAARSSEEYKKKMDEWKKDSRFNAVKNQKVFDSIKA